MLASYIFLASSLSIAAAALNPVNDHVDRDPGSFENPSQHVRPRFRYWIPDASVELSEIANDLELVKRAGAGGMELLGFYYYGATQSTSLLTVPSDWTKYGWGTDAWRNLTLFTLQECKARDLLLDFALGPNQGSGVPAEPESEGLMTDLIPFNVSFPLNGTFDGQVPGWGTGEHVSSSVGLVVSSAPASLSANPGFLGPVYYNGTNYTLDASSLHDVTEEVSSNGQLKIQMPVSTMGLEYRLFSFYQKYSGYREQASPSDLNQDQVPQSPVTSYVENGSWVPDHFSSRGAQVVIDFWEQNLLDDQSRALFREVGNYGWEDSMEFGTGVAVWWTPKMLQRFKATKGYDFNKYLPLLFSHVSSHPGPLPSPDIFYLNDADQGSSYLSDYYEMLTILNRDYLTALKEWLASSLDSKLSVQVVYNLPMEMAANVPAVDVPECESLGFNHNVDAYRQFSGPANLAGKRIISNELGAVQGAAYTQTIPELIWDIKRSILGGVNEMILHGYPFSGYYPNNTWPGYTTFYYRFSSMHGPRQPAWEYYDDFMNWTARMQYVAQSGVAKIDLAIWNHDDVTYDIFTKYVPHDLQDYGFSYNYISPSNFNLKDVYVANNTLAPKQQAFKALIVRQNDTMTLAGVNTLTTWANQGLPVVFSGGLPSAVSAHVEQQNLPAIEAILQNLTTLPNVYTVPDADLAKSLVTIVGLSPRTRVQSNRPWLTYWREDEDSSISYAILYNDAAGVTEPSEARSTGSVTFATSGAPYTYDAWTGQKTPVLAFEETCEGITIPIALEGNQTTIIAFHHNEARKALSHPAPTGLSTSSARKTTNGTTEVTTCIASNHTGPLTLQPWTLVVEAWQAPTNDPHAFAQNYTSPRTNTTTFHLPTLQPWSTLSSTLRNISGRGFYTTTFSWPHSHSSSTAGAILNLTSITNTARVWINGQRVPPLDPTRPVADISELLVGGQNSIEIVVATTLGGAVRAAWDEIQVGTLPVALTAVAPDEQDYGLVYPVEVVECERRTVTV